jgi:hypothetical protein
VRVIDYYENSGEGLPHYVKILRDKPYNYGQIWAPHDIMVRELTSGRSRLETALSLGLRFQIHPRHSIEDGIHAVRLLLPKCYFDVTKCQVGIESLRTYRKSWNERLGEHTGTPIHDKASHAADAFRGLAVRQKPPKDTKPKSPRQMDGRVFEEGWGAAGSNRLSWMR